MQYNFNYGWRFFLADAFPLDAALDKTKDKNGRCFFEPDYDDSVWESVSVPHTFNAAELFSRRIEDGGANQTRTFAMYRKRFDVPEGDNKIIIAFEGIRQTCFLYVNGTLAGFYENGVAPFGFDITAYIKPGEENLIAIATDNTATRNIPFCMAETPNYPDALPGSYLCELDAGTVDESRKGVGFMWNCNDFNPSIGGLTKNITLHIKPRIYLTLPLYTNLQTTGTYIFADKFDFEKRCADINVLSEIKNESGKDITCAIECVIADAAGNEAARFTSGERLIRAAETDMLPPLSITPRAAYTKRGDHYVEAEDQSYPTELAPHGVESISAKKRVEGLKFWSVSSPSLYTVSVSLIADGKIVDEERITTGFRDTSYDGKKGLMMGGEPVWLTGYAQRSANEWAAVGAACDWLKDFDARLIRESNANHIRWMHVAACPADIRSCDEYGIVCTQPAGDKERETFGREWKMREELMRDVIIYFRNSPSILFWEVGNNAVSAEHMRAMRKIKEQLDPSGGRYIGCRTLSTPEAVAEAEYVGTMLNRHAGRFMSERVPILETEYLREESPRRVWDDFSPPDYDYDNCWAGKGGLKKLGIDVYDLTAEDFALCAADGYSEFFHDRMGGASGKDLYSATAALCWTDSAQHGRQSASENARMSGRVDAARVKKQSFDVFRVMQSERPAVKIMGHWSYPENDGENYKYPVKRFNGEYWEKTGEFAYRDPEHKTVYVIGSYPVKKVELIINGGTVGVCEKPERGFVFAFEGIDITRSGYIKAVAYGYDDKPAAEDIIYTAKEPAAIRLTPHISDAGFAADGSDIAFCDIEVVDANGNICPLCYERIDFEIEGEGVFLGGYNSGKFDGFGHNDSVIHKKHVFAECGTNRVFIRSTKTPGVVRLKAKMGDITAGITLKTKKADTAGLSTAAVPRLANIEPAPDKFRFTPIPGADAAKYMPDEKIWCKVLINRDEADTRGYRCEYLNDAVYGPIIYILERIERSFPGRVAYTLDGKRLTIKSGETSLVLEVGHTHMLVNGKENLLNGEPYIEDGLFIAELSAILPHICDEAYYDENVNLYRTKFI